MMCGDIVRGVGANSATRLRGSNAQKRANANLVQLFFYAGPAKLTYCDDQLMFPADQPVNK